MSHYCRKVSVKFTAKFWQCKFCWTIKMSEYSVTVGQVWYHRLPCLVWPLQVSHRRRASAESRRRVTVVEKRIDDGQETRFNRPSSLALDTRKSSQLDVQFLIPYISTMWCFLFSFFHVLWVRFYNKYIKYIFRFNSGICLNWSVIEEVATCSTAAYFFGALCT